MQDGSCEGLPVAVETNIHGTWMVSFWQPDPNELVALQAGGGIMLQVRTLEHPVVSLGTYSADGRPTLGTREAPASAMDIVAMRAAFEDAALSHAIRQRIAGKVLDDNGAEFTKESLFWRKPSGDYGIAQFNAAWWGYQMALNGKAE